VRDAAAVYGEFKGLTTPDAAEPLALATIWKERGCQRSAAREENVFELARHRTPARLQTQDDAGTRPRGLVQRKGPADAGACSLVCLACLLTNHQNHTSKHSRRRLPGIGAVAAKPALDFSEVRIRMISLSRRPSLAVMRTSGGKWQTQLWIHTLQTQVRIHSLPIHDCVKHQESGTHRRQQGAADGVRALDWRPARGARRAGAAERPLNGPCDEELPPVLSPLEIPGTAMLQQVQSEPNRKVGMQRAHLARVVWLRSSCAPAEDSAFAPLCLCTS